MAKSKKTNVDYAPKPPVWDSIRISTAQSYVAKRLHYAHEEWDRRFWVFYLMVTVSRWRVPHPRVNVYERVYRVSADPNDRVMAIDKLKKQLHEHKIVAAEILDELPAMTDADIEALDAINLKFAPLRQRAVEELKKAKREIEGAAERVENPDAGQMKVIKAVKEKIKADVSETQRLMNKFQKIANKKRSSRKCQRSYRSKLKK